MKWESTYFKLAHWNWWVQVWLKVMFWGQLARFSESKPIQVFHKVFTLANRISKVLVLTHFNSDSNLQHYSRCLGNECILFFFSQRSCNALFDPINFIAIYLIVLLKHNYLWRESSHESAKPKILIQSCDQSYKCSTIVNYDSRVVITSNF